MEYGMTIPRMDIATQPDPLRYLNDFARAANQMGCAYCVIGDRLEAGMDAFNVLTAIAEASGNMRLVTSVLILPPRGILVSAKQYAALDILTGGRVIAGVGTGSMYRDYEVVGMDHDDMWPRFEEGVKAMRAYLTPGAPPFKGRFYDTTGVNLEPKPIQKPALPIWIGSWGSNVGLRRVARLADGWLSSAGPGHQSPEQFAEDVKRLNAFLVEEGKDPDTFPSAVSTMTLFISEDAEERERIGGPGYFPRPEGVGVAQPAARPSEDAHAHDMIGSRAVLLDKVKRWKAAGVKALYLVPRGPDPLGQMRLFMDEVASKA
jgi:alkanesulfonate monooxygenase SsuD/methylene tetrahydromethanopterin reductase-like flavin-dependent oxidoreductase (luciferase family)